MEAFKYYLNIDLNNNKKEEPSKLNHYLNDNWSLFDKKVKKIIIKNNIGKLIGYCGDNIQYLRKNNKNTIITINGPSNIYKNREVVLYGNDIDIINVLTEIKILIGEENLICV